MAFTPTFGTGFEMGSVEVIPPDNRSTSNVAISTTAKTGTYALRIHGQSYSNAWIRFAHSGSYLDMSAWLQVDDVQNGTYCWAYVEAQLSDGTTVGLRRFNGPNSPWDAYVNGVLVANGAINVAADVYSHLQMRIFIDNSAGYIQSRINGNLDIEYSGDTQPGSSAEISYLRILVTATMSGAASYLYIDDVAIGNGGWPGDIRFDRLIPNGDASVQFTPSAGSSNYALVNEIPPSDSEYVYTDSPNKTDIYTMSDWNETNKSPLFLMAWLRAKKDAAANRYLDFGVESGGSVSSSGSQILAPYYQYFSYLIPQEPSAGSPWMDETIDGVKFWMKSI